MVSKVLYGALVQVERNSSSSQSQKDLASKIFDESFTDNSPENIQKLSQRMGVIIRDVQSGITNTTEADTLVPVTNNTQLTVKPINAKQVAADYSLYALSPLLDMAINKSFVANWYSVQKTFQLGDAITLASKNTSNAVFSDMQKVYDHILLFHAFLNYAQSKAVGNKSANILEMPAFAALTTAAKTLVFNGAVAPFTNADWVDKDVLNTTVTNVNAAYTTAVNAINDSDGIDKTKLASLTDITAEKTRVDLPGKRTAVTTSGIDATDFDKTSAATALGLDTDAVDAATAKGRFNKAKADAKDATKAKWVFTDNDFVNIAATKQANAQSILSAQQEADAFSGQGIGPADTASETAANTQITGLVNSHQTILEGEKNTAITAARDLYVDPKPDLSSKDLSIAAYYTAKTAVDPGVTALISPERTEAKLRDLTELQLLIDALSGVNGKIPTIKLGLNTGLSKPALEVNNVAALTDAAAVQTAIDDNDNGQTKKLNDAIAALNSVDLTTSDKTTTALNAQKTTVTTKITEANALNLGLDTYLTEANLPNIANSVTTLTDELETAKTAANANNLPGVNGGNPWITALEIDASQKIIDLKASIGDGAVDGEVKAAQDAAKVEAVGVPADSPILTTAAAAKTALDALGPDAQITQTINDAVTAATNAGFAPDDCTAQNAAATLATAKTDLTTAITAITTGVDPLFNAAEVKDKATSTTTKAAIPGQIAALTALVPNNAQVANEGEVDAVIETITAADTGTRALAKTAWEGVLAAATTITLTDEQKLAVYDNSKTPSENVTGSTGVKTSLEGSLALKKTAINSESWATSLPNLGDAIAITNEITRLTNLEIAPKITELKTKVFVDANFTDDNLSEANIAATITILTDAVQPLLGDPNNLNAVLEITSKLSKVQDLQLDYQKKNALISIDHYNKVIAEIAKVIAIHTDHKNLVALKKEYQREAALTDAFIELHTKHELIRDVVIARAKPDALRNLVKALHRRDLIGPVYTANARLNAINLVKTEYDKQVALNDVDLLYKQIASLTTLKTHLEDDTKLVSLKDNLNRQKKIEAVLAKYGEIAAFAVLNSNIDSAEQSIDNIATYLNGKLGDLDAYFPRTDANLAKLTEIYPKLDALRKVRNFHQRQTLIDEVAKYDTQITALNTLIAAFTNIDHLNAVEDQLKRKQAIEAIKAKLDEFAQMYTPLITRTAQAIASMETLLTQAQGGVDAIKNAADVRARLNTNTAIAGDDNVAYGEIIQNRMKDFITIMNSVQTLHTQFNTDISASDYLKAGGTLLDITNKDGAGFEGSNERTNFRAGKNLAGVSIITTPVVKKNGVDSVFLTALDDRNTEITATITNLNNAFIQDLYAENTNTVPLEQSTRTGLVLNGTNIWSYKAAQRLFFQEEMLRAYKGIASDVTATKVNNVVLSHMEGAIVNKKPSDFEAFYKKPNGGKVYSDIINLAEDQIHGENSMEELATIFALKTGLSKLFSEKFVNFAKGNLEANTLAQVAQADRTNFKQNFVNNTDKFVAV